MGRFSNLVSKAGEMVQQANQEYQKAKQQQQQQQQQPQQQRQYGQPAQYGQHQYGVQPGQQQYPPQYEQAQQYNNQQYNPQQPATLPATLPWQQYQPQFQQQQQNLYAQHPTQPLAAPYYDAAQIHNAAEQAVARVRAQHQQAVQGADQQLAQLRERLAGEKAAAEKQMEADRQYAERLAAQYREEAEEGSRRAEAELGRLRAEASEQQRQAGEVLRQQKNELWQQMEQLKLRSEPPPMPPRPQNVAGASPLMPQRPWTDQVSGVTGSATASTLASPAAEMPPPVPIASRPGVAQGAGGPIDGRASDHSSINTQIPVSSAPSVPWQQPPGYPASLNPFKQDQIPAPTNTAYQGLEQISAAIRQSVIRPISQQPPQAQNSQSYLTNHNQTGAQTIPQGHHSPTSSYINQPVQQYAPPQIHSAETNTPRQFYPQPPTQPSTMNTDTQSITNTRYTRTPPLPQPHPSGVSPMAECVSDLVTYDMDWFYHPDAPTFFICPKCYVDHIWDTQFRGVFKRQAFADQKPRRCLFGARRMKEQLWPEAASSGNMGPAIEFFKHAPSLGDCPQENIKENETWYTSADVPGMTMCRSCFENDFAGTPFAEHFRLEKTTQAFCDSSAWYIKRLYEDHAKTGNWSAFAEGAKVRVGLPACPKQTAVKASGRTWYKPIRLGPDAPHVCEACYYDYFYASPDQEAFQQVAGGNYNTSCVMGRLNIVIPLRHAIAKKDREIFWRAAAGVEAQPFCDENGIKGATWYTLPSDPQGFGVCGACYASIVQTIGGTKLFVPKRGVSGGEALVCCFNQGHSRAGLYLARYAESVLKGSGKPLNDFVLKLSSVPPCQRRHLRGTGGRKAWGWGVAAICEECYLTFAQGTSLEPRFVLKGQHDAPDHERMCDLYSPRMRELYTQACRTGDLEGFLAHGERRHQVWCETIPVCEALLNQQMIAALQAQTLGISGSFYKALGGSVDATQGHSYTVGNSYAGYGHANEWVLQGHVYDRQSRETAAGAMSPGYLMQVSMLEQRWAEVE